MKYKILLSVLIGLCSILGDHIVFNTTYSGSHIYRGIADNLVHGAIGMLSASLFLYDTSHTRDAIAINVAVCTALSSFIDFDHVIVARSIYWKDLKNFKYRGFLHCSTVWFILSLLLILCSQFYRKTHINMLGWMSLLAFTSHHTRDAHRRGFWVWPFGDTRPINKHVYVLLLVLLPNIFTCVYRQMKPGMLRYKTVDYQLV